MRVLYLDVGDKRMVSALSDPTRAPAQVLDVHTRATVAKDLEILKKIMVDREVGEIVKGLPKDLHGARAASMTGFALDIEHGRTGDVTIFSMARINHKKNIYRYDGVTDHTRRIS